MLDIPRSRFRILVVDDNVAILDRLRALLETQPELTVVGSATDGIDAVRLAKILMPDLVIMDVRMPHMNGIDATRAIIADDPRAKILCHSMHPEEELARTVLQAGARGYLLKGCSFDELKEAIHEILAGGACFPPGLDVATDAGLRYEAGAKKGSAE
ncbi:MAG: response regulator transcription factor [Rhodothermales bacterium]|nr:response regulator transcription factor [Rhodothermales bacterium]